ncbi:MAG: glutamate-cysteine ligase family protein [Balneolaceae bacterium]|nr:glutamate-cysteine ligase family protein [Balneolaceae bacterium]
MSTNSPLHLFQAFGIELEYMIVDRDSLDVRPVTDRLLHKLAGSYINEVERGDLAWSNELALHVLEFKTNGPAAGLGGLHRSFQREVEEANRLLAGEGACLMPTAMHPWMDPYRELKLWPHEYNPIYEAYNRIFDCRGHGWANLQSMHLNLPFQGDEEFGRLHAAIRVVLPLLPALAASSPVADGELKSFADYRLEVYRGNSHAVPSVLGWVVPEAVSSRAEYQQKIFQPMYRDIAPHDPEGILADEWLNSRGAIARFDRGSIEIRLVDVQECSLADLALARMVTDTVRALADERWAGLEELNAWDEKELFGLMMEAAREGEEARIDSPGYLALFGMEGRTATAGEVWQHLHERIYGDRRGKADEQLAALARILEAGTLSTRIRRRVGPAPDRPRLKQVYRELTECLGEGRLLE